MASEFLIEAVSLSGKSLGFLRDLDSTSTIEEVKYAFRLACPKYYVERQSWRLDAKSKSLRNDQVLKDIGINHKDKLCFKDLGPQIGWTTVFLCEYAGPLFVYSLFYTRPAIFYGVDAIKEPRAFTVQLAMACWGIHYIKRLYETIFIHRFSNATMPIKNLFINCSYYWGFAAFISYFINHPLYTSPSYGDLQMYAGLTGFILGELGNLSTHIAFRNLRPPGTKERHIPNPTSNPFTSLFNLVSCPNYTYEGLAWVSFSMMTQCLPALIFTVAGFYQMSIWAIGKHRNYRKEFKNYPKNRKSIIPFII